MEDSNYSHIEKKVIPLWGLTVWLVVMNTTMFNVALPSVISEFQLTPTAGSIIVSGYSIAFAISTITYSRLSDFLPIRTLLISALILVGTSSFIGYLAHSFSLLIIGRFLQALGAGAVPGLAMVLAARYILLARRGRAMSLISSAASLGFGLGPVVGGALTQWWGWNSLFMVTALVLLLIPLYHKWLPLEKRQTVEFDSMGAFLTALGVAGTLAFLVTFKLWVLGGSLVVWLLLWRHIHRLKKKTPFIQPALLKQSRFLMLLFMGFSAFSTHFAILFLIPIILAVLFGKSPAFIGLVIFPGAMLSAIAAIFIGKAIDRLGNTPLIMAGHSLLGLSTICLAFFSDVSPYVIMVIYMLTSTGFTSLTSSLSNEVSRILDKSLMGAGMGLLQLIQFIGGAIGVTIAGLFLDLSRHLQPDVMYRNVFLTLTGLVLSSFALYAIYRKQEKETSQLQNSARCT
ncbi:MFS transporter [Ammoniphilus sp. CFH 90114]|uniref:MFS transporter n=1 Tax=Ammoniphilus sp. CFH 90114 TaxID=2493665 RepID=UPI00100DC4F7|nr:MFS transporter [Ammoniphilus sp. CFH 90114]RXT15380.1 MFS transporter [Ammoniphilus sp. CFH 90114]